MKIGKRGIALLLTLLLIFSAVPAASAQELEPGTPGTLTEVYINEATSKEIADAKTSKATEVLNPQSVKGYVYDNTYSETLEHVYSKDDLTYLFGYPDKTVRGERYLSRAEAAAIFYRLFDGYYPAFSKDMTANTFTDVNLGAWYYKEVETLYNLGIVGGYSDGTFRPNSPVSRAEFAQLAYLFGGLPRVDTAVFSDVTKEHWAYTAINAAAAAGWISGYGDGTYRPDKDITRAETVALINRIINRSITLERLKELNVQNPYTDLVESYWAYTDLIQATVKHSLAEWYETKYNDGKLNVIIERYVDADGNEISTQTVSDGKEQVPAKDFDKYTYMGYVRVITYQYTKGTAELQVTKAVDKANASVGDKLVYTVEASNIETASDKLENVVMRDTLTGYVDFTHGSVQVGGKTADYAYDDATRLLSVELGDIEPGAKVSITFEVVVNQSAYGKTISNTVVVSADNDGDKSATDEGTVIEDGTAKMSISKSVDKTAAKVGDTLVYTIKVSNADTAEVNIKGAAMRDTLSEFLTFAHGSLQVDGLTVPYSYDNASRTLSVELYEIAPGQTKTVTFEAVVNSSAYGQTISNTAIASAENEDDKEATDEGVTIEDGTPEGSAGAKTVSASTAKVGDTLTYTITLRNASTATADWTNVVVTDEIPEYLEFVSGSVEEDGRASTNASYNAGSKTLTLYADSIAIGETRTFTFKVQVSDGAQGMYLVNTAIVSSDGREDIQLPDTGVQIDAGEAKPFMTKTASVTEAHEGDIFNYSVTLKNGAEATASWKNITMTDVIPDGLKLVSGSVTLDGQTVSYGYAGQAIEVTVGDLAAGAEAVVKFQVRVQDGAAGSTIHNVAVGKGDNGDKTVTDDGVSIPVPENPGDNGGDDEDTVTGSKSVDKTLVSTGDKVVFTIKAKNNSPETWTGVQVYDVLDTSMVTLITDTIYIDGVRYAQSSNKWLYSDKQLVFNLGDIEPGKEVVCQFSVQMKNDAAGMVYTNHATIKGTDGQIVYVKSPEITILPGDNGSYLPNSDIHYALFSGHGDHLGNPLYLWGPSDNIKLEHMCIAAYRLMTDNFKTTKGMGTHTVPDGVTRMESKFFISHGVISSAEFTAGADATESQICRILAYASNANISSNSTNSMKRSDVASLICDVTGRDKSPNTNGLPVAYFSDKGGNAALIDEVSNTHEYTLDSAGKETWQSLVN